MATQRRHRLELPGVPNTDDPVALKKYLTDLRRLTMDEFNRMSTDLFDFKQEVINSAGFTLQAVSNINVIATSYGATFSWVLPQQSEVTPTHVRVRIAEFGDAWAEFNYPLTSWSVNALLPGLEYTFQIQLVYRGEVMMSYVSAIRNCPSVPTLVESTSEIRSRSFTTASGVGPPADGGGGNTTFPIPDTTTCVPGTGGVDGEWEWKIQIASETDGTWSDTAHDGTIDGDADLTIDTTVATGLGLLSTRVYRVCIRELCDGVATGDGSYTCGEPFTGDNDWLDACGGTPVNDSASQSPYDTANLFAIPLGCLPTAEGFIVIDDVSDIEVIRGDDLLLTVYQDGEWTFIADDLTANSNYWGQIGWVLLPLIADLNNTDDVAFSLWYKVDTLFPSGGVVVLDPLLGVGSGRLVISLRSDGTNYGFQVTAQRETGGALIIQTPLDKTPDGNFHVVTFTSDANGNKELTVDNDDPVVDSTGIELRWDNNDGGVRIYAHTDAQMNRIYGWNNTITPPVYTGLLYAALVALNPVLLWPLREASGTAIDDVSTNDNDGTYSNTPTFAALTGPDGNMYPTFSSGDLGAASDNSDYSIATGSGLTVIMMIYLPASGGSSGATTIFGKYTDGSATDREWLVQIASDGSQLIADTFDSGGSLARRSFNFAPGWDLGAWNMVIVRFPSSTSGYPTLRVNGSNLTVGTTGSGTTRGDAATDMSIEGANATGYALFTLVAGEMSDGDCSSLESVAQSEGWIA